jgi:hypothetical protein
MDAIAKEFDLNLNDKGDVVLSEEERVSNAWDGMAVGVLVAVILVWVLQVSQLSDRIVIAIAFAIIGFIMGKSTTTETTETWQVMRFFRSVSRIELIGYETLVHNALGIIDSRDNHQGNHISIGGTLAVRYITESHEGRERMEQELIMAKILLPMNKEKI